MTKLFTVPTVKRSISEYFYTAEAKVATLEQAVVGEGQPRGFRLEGQQAVVSRLYLLERTSDFDVVRSADDGSSSINFQNFYWTLGFTILWTISNVFIGTTLGLILALILNVKELKLKPLYRIILILPWAVPNYITALIWKGMFHKQFGVINQVIQIGGGEPVSWFDAWYTSFFAVLMTNGWLSFPFMMVIALGALQSIPGDLYEELSADPNVGYSSCANTHVRSAPITTSTTLRLMMTRVAYRRDDGSLRNFFHGPLHLIGPCWRSR